MFKQNGRLKSIHVHEYTFIETPQSEQQKKHRRERKEEGERERDQ